MYVGTTYQDDKVYPIHLRTSNPTSSQSTTKPESRTRKELVIRRKQQQAGKDLDSDYGHEDDLGGVLNTEVVCRRDLQPCFWIQRNPG